MGSATKEGSLFGEFCGGLPAERRAAKWPVPARAANNSCPAFLLLIFIDRWPRGKEEAGLSVNFGDTERGLSNDRRVRENFRAESVRDSTASNPFETAILRRRSTRDFTGGESRSRCSGKPTGENKHNRYAAGS